MSKSRKKFKRKHLARILKSVAIAKLASHPGRLEALEMLANGSLLSPVEFSRRTDEGLSQSSYIFKTLREGGAAEVKEEVDRRGAKEHKHRITSLGKEILAHFPPS